MLIIILSHLPTWKCSREENNDTAKSRASSLLCPSKKNDELGWVWLNSIDLVRQKLGEDNVHKKKEKKRKWVSPNWAKEDMNDEKTASNNTAVHIIKKILN